MSALRRLAVAFVSATVTLAGAGCQFTSDSQGSSVKTQSAKMPDLPDDPVAAKAVVRKMLMDEAIVLLKAVSSQKYGKAQFDVPIFTTVDISQYLPYADDVTRVLTAT
jgi:hypothetical protein